MRFGLTDEQELIQRLLRKFAAKDLPVPRLRAIFDRGRSWDEPLWSSAAGAGSRASRFRSASAAPALRPGPLPRRYLKECLRLGPSENAA